MIEQAGPRCDVCGEFILVTMGKWFQLGGIEQELCAHAPKCIDLMRAASEANDVSLLPDGPVRRAYEKAAAEEARHER